MTSKPDIFDTSDVSDLPRKARKGLAPEGDRRTGKGGKLGKRAYADLIREAGRPLTRRELYVARWRSTGSGPSHLRYVGDALRLEVARGQIVKVGDGTYGHHEGDTG